MSFASWPFLLWFLPVTLGMFACLQGPRASTFRQAWLIAASLLFYGWAGSSNVGMLAASILVNFSAGAALTRLPLGTGFRKFVLWGAVAANLAMLVGFKLAALDAKGAYGFLSGSGILIPLAISFITFQQIGFVIACYRGAVRPTFFNYLFFVTFFPQLVLGPILEFGAVDRQLKERRLARLSAENLSVGLAIFTYGLAKKVLLADNIAQPVNRIFDGAAAGFAPTSAEAWYGIAAFTFQIVLDFSAYSEMAIGLAKMVNIDLPINFDAPLKAVNRFDMWRRWHITYVVFMRNYVFMPLVRHWGFPTWAALAATGLLSGLWHGFGWTFIVWGLVQTILLLALHVRFRRQRETARPTGLRRARAIATTFLVTCMLGVLFRSPTLGGAGTVYLSLASIGGGAGSLSFADLLLILACAFCIWVLPDAKPLFGRWWTALDPRLRTERPSGAERSDRPPFIRFLPDPAWGVGVAVLFLVTVVQLGYGARFIYAQF